jgi:hypothetical protein
MPAKGWLKATAKRHGHYSGPSGYKATKWDAGKFAAWDGEGGCGRGCRRACDHPQDYLYLANSEGGELVREGGISTAEAFDFLTAEARRLGPHVTHVCFGLSYDANEMLRDVPRLKLRELWNGERVQISRRFRAMYRPRKSLWVKNYTTGSSLTVWDVFGFYQTSFIRAVADNLGAADPRLPIIRKGKARRGTFRAADLPSIRPYTQAELSALVDLCVRLRASFAGAGLRLKRWDGAGAAAAALLERQRIKRHLAPVPPAVHEAALYAFAGGRIEDLRYGYHEGEVHHADIRSAYPDAAKDLPSLRGGRWTRTGKERPDGFSIIKVRWDFSRMGDRRSILPFPFRAHDGSIYFPRRGTSWVWRPELDAALHLPDLARRVEILDGWRFTPRDEAERPFGWIPYVYQERERLKRAKNAAQKALKLGLNSVYGKLAQHIGGRDGHPPPFHQIEYAGWITSATRARLFAAAAQAGDECITLATDGIYSMGPMRLRVADELGGWDYSVHEAMLIAQSGVYWLRDTPKDPERCDACDGPVEEGPLGSIACRNEACGWSNLTQHYRGFDEGSLTPEAIMEAWLAGNTTVCAESTRYVTLGRATRTERSFKAWRKWITDDRTLDVHAVGKREDRVPPSRWSGARHPLRGLLPTDPADPHEAVSTPYTVGWADERAEPSMDAQEQVSL